MREHTESPVHVYQEIDSVDTVDCPVAKPDQGDQLELDILCNKPTGLLTLWTPLCHGLEWIVDVLI